KPPFKSTTDLNLCLSNAQTTFFHTSIITKNPPLEIDDFYALHVNFLNYSDRTAFKDMLFNYQPIGMLFPTCFSLKSRL
ncbi:TPA: hypothetical protein ACXJRB_002802, partial [Enterococcus faecalis]